jgi:hypothetical protein
MVVVGLLAVLTVVWGTWRLRVANRTGREMGWWL